MSGLILHHYPESLYSERVRLAMGLKGLAYRSVRIPIALPKPDLLPLTGGYRRTPVMQIGADIYCDTLLILRKIEALHPAPSLYPGQSEGAATALAWWSDRFIIPHALGIMAAEIGHSLPRDFIDERNAFGFPLDPGEAAAGLHRHLQQASAHLDWLGAMLAGGRPFLLGSQPGAADLAAYCPLWLLRTRVGAKADALLPLAPLEDWYARLAALGHGHPEPLSSGEALDVALASTPAGLDGGADADPSGIRVGREVIVRADDTGRDPVRGTLVSADAEELVIRTEHPRVGSVNIHFPRAGFDMVPA